jgi:hypothetical protein
MLVQGMTDPRQGVSFVHGTTGQTPSRKANHGPMRLAYTSCDCVWNFSVAHGFRAQRLTSAHGSVTTRESALNFS